MTQPSIEDSIKININNHDHNFTQYYINNKTTSERKKARVVWSAGARRIHLSTKSTSCFLLIALLSIPLLIVLLTNTINCDSSLNDERDDELRKPDEAHKLDLVQLNTKLIKANNLQSQANYGDNRPISRLIKRAAESSRKKGPARRPVPSVSKSTNNTSSTTTSSSSSRPSSSAGSPDEESEDNDYTDPAESPDPTDGPAASAKRSSRPREEPKKGISVKGGEDEEQAEIEVKKQEAKIAKGKQTTAKVLTKSSTPAPSRQPAKGSTPNKNIEIKAPKSSTRPTSASTRAPKSPVKASPSRNKAPTVKVDEPEDTEKGERRAETEADEESEEEEGPAGEQEGNSNQANDGDEEADSEQEDEEATVPADGEDNSRGASADEDDDEKPPSAKEATIKATKSNATTNDNLNKLNKNNNNSTMKNSNSTNLTTSLKSPLVKLPFIKAKNASACTPEAYLEFPNDLIGDKWRSRGLVIIHIAVVCYMFYSLALVCEKYFIPSLEEFSQRLNLSDDVAGATLMSAGSSAPELFTAILGVFIAKGDVGTGAIVGSAVFNILFVIGICAFVSTTAAQLNWWPVLRDSIFYTLTVLVLIVVIYDERVTALESFLMIALYGVYIIIMSYNDFLRQLITKILLANPNTAKLISSLTNSDEVFEIKSSACINSRNHKQNETSINNNNQQKQTNIEDDSMFLAACLIIIQHKRLFRSRLRFQAASRYIIIKRQHRIQEASRRQKEQLKLSKQHQHHQSHLKHQQPEEADEVNYIGPENEPLNGLDSNLNGDRSHQYSINQKKRIEAYAKAASVSKSKFSIVSRDDYEFWNRPPEEGENYYLWMLKIPVNYVLHYTIPDCVLYPDKYIIAFFMSIFWTAFFSYINVWMVTLIGYTFGIPDSVMGFTFLAAGTSVPDCYSSIHAAKNGMADMAVSNSIGSNVFDILIGLAVPWFIQSAIYPGVTATINSRGIVYSVILLFLSLIVTIYLMNKYEWTLKPRLGLALLIAYALFIALTCMLEFNLFGYVNPPSCLVT